MIFHGSAREGESVTELRIDPGVIFVSMHRGIWHDYRYYPVDVGRDENDVPTALDVFAEVDAQTPKLITLAQRSAR